jgi:hypothetical protein
MREKLRTEEGGLSTAWLCSRASLWKYEIKQAAVNNEHARKEKGGRKISSDVLGSQYWEDNQQNTESCGTRKSALSFDDGCSRLKRRGDVFYTKSVEYSG